MENIALLKHRIVKNNRHRSPLSRGEICPSRHCRWQCKIFTNGVNFSSEHAIYNINESTLYPDFLISKTVDLLTISSFITQNVQIIDIRCIYVVSLQEKMSQFTHFCGVQFLAWKYGNARFWTNIMSGRSKRTGVSPTLSWKWPRATLSPSFGNHSFGVKIVSQIFQKPFQSESNKMSLYGMWMTTSLKEKNINWAQCIQSWLEGQ